MVSFTRNDRLNFTGSATLYRQCYTLPEIIGYTLLTVLLYRQCYNLPETIGYTLLALLHYTGCANFRRNDRLHYTGSATIQAINTLPEMIGYTLLAVLHYTVNDTLYQK